MVQLDVQRATVVTDRDGRVQSSVFNAQIVQQSQGLPSEPTQLRVVTLAFQFSDDHQWEHHVVISETGDGSGIREQYRRVDDERAADAFGGGCLVKAHRTL